MPRFSRTFIRVWRQHRRLTLEQLAQRVGMSPSLISMLERGRRGYTQETMEALARALNTDVTALLTRRPPKARAQAGLRPMVFTASDILAQESKFLMFATVQNWLTDIPALHMSVW